MTSTAHQSQFAPLPFPPGSVASKAGRLSLLTPSSLPATFNDHEHRSAYDASMGLARFGRHRQAPVHGGWGAGSSPRVGSTVIDRFSSDLTLPRYLGRRLRAGGSFPILTADGHGCRRVLAVDYQSADDLPCHAVQPLKRHSSASVRYRTNRSEGDRGSAPNHAGEIPEQQGERRHVACV